MCVCLVAKSSPTLCNPMDCNPSGSSVHGISQARILERVAAESLREALIAKGPGLISDQGRKIP